jgi:hypothetical protein
MLFNLKIIIIFIFITIAFTGCGSEFETLLDGKTAARNYTFSWDEFSGIYWSEADGTIHRINFDGTGEEILRVSSNIPLDIAIDTINSRIFWTEYTGSAYRICRGGFNEDDTVVVYTSSYGPTAIVIDNSAGVIYWNEYQTASSHHDIWRCNITDELLTGTKWFNELANTYYDTGITLGSGNAGSPYRGTTATSNSDTLITSLNGPTVNSVPFKGIATDGTYVYFAANTTHGTWPRRISRAGLDLIVSDEGWLYQNITDIQKIAIDLTNHKIYWTSQTDKRIYRADLDVAAPNGTAGIFITLDSMPTGICISH